MNFYQLVSPEYFFRTIFGFWGTSLQCLPFLASRQYNATNMLNFKEIIVGYSHSF